MQEYLKKLLEGKKGRGVKAALEGDETVRNFLDGLLASDPGWDNRTEAARYVMKTGRTELPKCIICGKSIRPKTLLDHPNASFCSLACSRTREGSAITRQKIEDTWERKYGTRSISSLEEIKAKKEQTSLKNYGAKYYTQTEEGKAACGFGQKKTGEQVEKLYTNGYESAVKREDALGFELLVSREGWKGVADGKYPVRCKTCGLETSHWTCGGAPAPCRNCHPKEHGRSEAEREISALFAGHFDENERDYLGFEVDFLSKDRKIAVEYDGLYWHSEKFRNGTYHLNKTEKCEEKGVQLLHIFEDEWNTKRRIVISRIRSHLGLVKNKIYARKCEVREIESKRFRVFCEKYHLQGSCPSSVRLGLFYKGRLVSVMGFAKPRFNKNYDWELTRFCSLFSFSIVGGASKILAAFRRAYEGSIISYADRRWSDGNVYKKLGFKELKPSAPAYYYVKNNSRYNRVMFQKHKLHKMLDVFDPEKSEHQNMLDNGFLRVWDCGNKVFVME